MTRSIVTAHLNPLPSASRSIAHTPKDSKLRSTLPVSRHHHQQQQDHNHRHHPQLSTLSPQKIHYQHINNQPQTPPRTATATATATATTAHNQSNHSSPGPSPSPTSPNPTAAIGSSKGIQKLRNTLSKRLSLSAWTEREILKKKNRNGANNNDNTNGRGLNYCRVPLTERNVGNWVEAQECEDACFPDRHNPKLAVSAWLERVS